MRRILVVVGVLCFCNLAEAAPFQNGSFENGTGTNPIPNLNCNQYNVPATDTRITGWIVTDGNIDWEGSNQCDGWVASDGQRSLDLIGSGVSKGGIAQTFDTIVGQTYRVAFDLAGNYGGPPTVKPLTVTVDGVTQPYTFDTTGKSATNMGWTPMSFTFVATSTTSTLKFVSDVGSTSNAGAALDNVTVDPIIASAIPTLSEVGFAVLAGLMALTGLIVLKRRSRGAGGGGAPRAA